MYRVSPEYLININKSGRNTRITGVMTLKSGQKIPINNEIIAKAPEINNQCSGDSELILGQAYQGLLKLSIYSETDRYSIYGARIELSFGLELDSGEFEEVPLGVYFVSECIRKSNDVLQITALDAINKLDKKYSGESVGGTPFQILSLVSKLTGVELGQSEEHIASMPNGEVIMALPESPKVNTFRDVVGDLAAVLGGFAMMDRQGRLIVRSFSSGHIRTIDADLRKKESVSDYFVKYSSVSCVKNGKPYSYGRGDGQELELKDNSFLQLGADETTYEILNNILSIFDKVEFTPTAFEFLGDPALDLGDMLQLTGYSAKVSTLVPIHKSNWKWRGNHKIDAVGKNPFLNAKSKESRAIDNALNQLTTIENTVVLMNNSSLINFDEEWELLDDIVFAMASEQNLLFNGVLKIDSLLSGSVSVKYAINDIDEPFIHVYQVPMGEHTITLFYPLRPDREKANSFKVYVKSDNTSGTIDTYGFVGAVSGSGIVSAEWDGTLTFEDKFSLSSIGVDEFNYVEGNVSVSDQTPMGGSFSDVFALSSIGVDIFEFRDTLRITTNTPEYQLITEDEIDVFTEDGDYIVTEK